jgi:hypothetical protein
MFSQVSSKIGDDCLSLSPSELDIVPVGMFQRETAEDLQMPANHWRPQIDQIAWRRCHMSFPPSRR